MTEEFIKRHKLQISSDNWLYKSAEFKMEYLKENTDYEVVDDYVIAYKSVKSDHSSVYNRQYVYTPGTIHEAHCNCNIDEDNSFGLSAWDYENAKGYYSKGKIMKVKIHVDDLGAVVHNGKKLRAHRLEILEEV